MIKETITHLINKLTTTIIESAYEPNTGLSTFQIVLISIGLISVIQSSASIFLNNGITGIFYIIGFVKWCYYKINGKEV